MPSHRSNSPGLCGRKQASLGLVVYRRAQCVLLAVLGVQFAGGLFTLLTPQHEVFPLFSWFLFPLTPNPGTRPALLLEDYRGTHYAAPVAVEKADGVLTSAQAPAVFALTQELGRAVAVANESEVSRLRRILEGDYLPGPGRYALAEITYDPIERFRSGHEQVRLIREFVIARP